MTEIVYILTTVKLYMFNFKIYLSCRKKYIVEKLCRGGLFKYVFNYLNCFFIRELHEEREEEKQFVRSGSLKKRGAGYVMYK